MKVNFIGNKKVADLLCNMIKNNKLSHSYLFYGAKGLGKTTLAQA
ncbi:MAG: DNA polymerase III subunit delta', partial [Oscillospiraceae bacterium]|nr:DNA polymerase III subunit delta' [Oscillospiraceae bacterium]